MLNVKSKLLLKKLKIISMIANINLKNLHLTDFVSFLNICGFSENYFIFNIIITLFIFNNKL